ncbi:hypothetical protein AWW66_11990 [Micromonospora rosaria]|uniref:N-acetyltransferase domain-containing protein n=1 Tax=Micromonospora rosaria TaxID=47874 RepID=A0A136PT96_9ACTN|nr:GNAT family N-acetyltransferase [Micromonospora rosaria]KXK61720.1 hypothetical protein AWW66_11990 [Micromonospora rosaria]
MRRLVRAAGGVVSVGLGETGREGGPSGESGVVPVPPVPHDERRDEGGRRYPAHLDVREVRTLRDWPGAWWAHWYTLPPERWPLRVPEATYDLDRDRRDRRRFRESVRDRVRVRRVDEGLPESSWRLVAELPDGGLIGELRAHERSEDLVAGQDFGDLREIVLDGVLVAPDFRELGIGRRLVGLLVAEMERAGVPTARAVAEFADGFLVACGFTIEASRPVSLCLRTPLSPGPPRQPSAR